MPKVSIETSDITFHFPLISDETFATQKLDDFQSLYNDSSADVIKNILGNKDHKNLILAIFSNSPYLTRLLFVHSEFALRLFNEDHNDLLNEELKFLDNALEDINNISDLMVKLRIAKAHIALIIGFADLSEKWKLPKITRALSDFAELALRLSVNFLIKDGINSGNLDHDYSSDDFSTNSGYVIMAMGKLGGYELNYSSDIDLIVLFDMDIVKYSGRRSPQDFFIKMTQKLVKIMSDRTADGYVFRTDLRLRPDPGATPVALSMEGAEVYYQSVGLNWERAAMIKARPIAGDIEAGLGFLERIRGFVWRRHLDYAAIEDIHAIKKLIHEHHSHRDIMLEGHDVKLGRGGIREIEFYAQIHQLISGGREPMLRIAPTCLALDALALNGKLSKEENDTLQEAYVFLRTLEHRLQMINDDQTHEIPFGEENLHRISKFMGFEFFADFEVAVIKRFNAVHKLFNALLEDTNQTHDEDDKTLSFPLDQYHPATLEAIETAGFHDAKKAYEIIQGWLVGRYRACRTDRARDILKVLTPEILKAFGKHSDPDNVLVKFDDFLSRLPSGVQLFSFIKAQPWLLDLLAQILGVAPFLSSQLSRNPLMLDAVLNAENFKKNSSLPDLQNSLDELLMTARDFQDILDLSRKWANEAKFQVGLQILRGSTDIIQSGRTLTDIAEVILSTMLFHVKNEFSKKHGTIENSSLCILGMGKLGGFDFTTTSDADIVLIYDADEMDVMSDGPKPLTVNHYYARLSQNFINSITALTGEGKLYEVDMRLRPSGTAGPLAVSFDSFNDYQHGQAWTWEHMALTRSRVIAGPENLKEKIEKCTFNILTHKGRDQENLLHEVAKMRIRMEENLGTENIWAMKQVRGGIIDIEFICQYLILEYASENQNILKRNTLKQIKTLTDEGYINQEKGKYLYQACYTMQTIQALLRLCMGTTSRDDDRPKPLLSALAERLECDIDDLEPQILAFQKSVLDLYKEIIEIPASNLKPHEPTNPIDTNKE
ncbi:bifunctional [glutamine synthetase] adenylyltransferase/[glutamine synthetase]-adenylyl-L-tyrosine phosphorylase [Pseudemcibacter aquimaris]|nr:bifunctional [glutamine synthetase] adenylyltransferase/[glutamine synthetase]-adenylyl-L-tyrosine phosphorylase [Pseudemcibacter aquimaris]WDU59731.1 bifunctional [glutamine synthetase] adenylyltransferase/[glutamine synthetase]-adenylyl-L-tyrosine phosphorylase [Pseudemcibacter aquimaris]